jgi:hypothetical protein
MNRKNLSSPNVRQLFLPGMLIILAVFFTGCFEYEERIVINRDGSGEMEVHYSGDADSDMNLDSFSLSKDDWEMREKIEDKFTAPGVRVKSYHSKIKGNDRHVYFTVAFDDFTRLARVRWWNDQHIEAGEKAGRHYWNRMLPGDNDPDDENSRFERWLKGKIADELEAHLKFRFVVETDGEIIEANSANRSPHRVVWHFNGADLLDPHGMEMKLSWR